MPGVAEQVKRTQLRQEQKLRRLDMEHILTLVREDRLHEADERQLETLKLALDLQKTLADKGAVDSLPVDTAAVISAVKEALAEVLQNVSGGAGTVMVGIERPSMKHTTLAGFEHLIEDVPIEHEEVLGEDEEGQEDSTDKLEKLRRLKGNR